jgi:hypothetical protein
MRLFASEQRSRPILFLYGLLALLAGCAMPAAFEAMIPNSFETAQKHPQSVRVRVTGGQDSEAAGRPHIPNSAFARALAESITQSQTFSRVIDEQGSGEEYLLTVTLFSIDKRIFGQTVKLEAGWTLRRGSSAVNVWQESIVSEYTGANVKLATEGAAKNNIAEGLKRISRINLK